MYRNFNTRYFGTPSVYGHWVSSEFTLCVCVENLIYLKLQNKHFSVILKGAIATEGSKNKISRVRCIL